jgi:uncharacterized protein (TIGR03437 family)
MRAGAALTALAMIVAANGSAATKGPDAGSYTATDSVVYSFIDISGPGGGTSALAGTDDATAALTLPFTFKFYGTSYTLVCASSNGALYFVPDSATCVGIAAANDFANTDLSVAGPPQDPPAALPFWTDLTFGVPGAGAVYYQSFGIAPNRRFVVQWSNAYANANPVTFEVILAEGTNALTFQYQTVTLGGGNPASNGGLSTIGVRNAGGVSNSQQIQWSFDAPVLSNSYAILFQAGAAPPSPVLTSPPNGATGVSTSTQLTWNAATGATSYDVYFGTTSPPTLATNTASTSYSPPGLVVATSYNWQIVAKNASGSSASAVQSFTTANQVCNYSLDSSGASFPSTGGSGSFNVITTAGCQWTVTGAPAWVNITSGSAGSGNGGVSYTLAANTGSTLSASLSVGGQSYNISEAGSVQAQPLIITWATPAPIIYGTPLSTAQLNATVSTPAFLVYSPSIGTILSAGPQTLSVTATSGGFPPTTSTVTLIVNPAPQTITFGPIAGHVSTDAPFSLSATASSGFPITFSVVSGPATIRGNTVTITGTGTVSVQANQAGDTNHSAATPVVQSFTIGAGTTSISSVLNAGSYANAPLASDGFTVIFGTNFSASTASATSLPLPATLAGTTVTITDSKGVTLPAQLNYVSPTQINFVVPEGLASGTATVTVTNASGISSNFTTTIAAISPSLFTADSSGKGAPAAIAVAYAADSSSQVLPVFSCSGSPVTCTATPIDLGPASTNVYLELFGTGIRGRSGLSGVTVTLGGTALQVTYAGAQGTYAGLDQVNLLLDRSLIGSGSLTLQLTADGVAANPVTVSIK